MNRFSLVFGIFPALGLLALAGAAAAEEVDPVSERRAAVLERYDVDGDGRLDRGERATRYRDRPRRDRDGNPPGRVGGPGTNWENPPGPRGGPGASPDRR